MELKSFKGCANRFMEQVTQLEEGCGPQIGSFRACLERGHATGMDGEQLANSCAGLLEAVWECSREKGIATSES